MIYVAILARSGPAERPADCSTERLTYPLPALQIPPSAIVGAPLDRSSARRSLTMTSATSRAGSEAPKYQAND